MVKPSTYYKGIRNEMVQFLPQKYSKVLEIGCGKGGFRASVHDDCEYWGVEPDKESTNNAKERLDNVLVGTFDDVFHDLPDNYFDLVICNDVIEHMVDHHLFYNKIKVKCAKDAYIVGSIPNVRHVGHLYDVIVKKDWEYQKSGILDNTHLRFFTLKSIKRDFANNQFQIEKLHGINKTSYSTRKFRGLKMILLRFLLGKDSKFVQFGFRVKLK